MRVLDRIILVLCVPNLSALALATNLQHDYGTYGTYGTRSALQRPCSDARLRE
jgi:hypothetical protein